MTFDEFLRSTCPPLGLQWRKYRRRAARHRLRDRMAVLGLPDFRTYHDYLQEHPSEADTLADRMGITVSRFFRERGNWEELTERAVPGALRRAPRRGTFRALSVGCCGGEEPFTLSILWQERLAPAFPGRRLIITAVDIDGESLRRAARGRYRGSSLREVPLPIRERWFRREHDLWKIDEKAAAPVRFEHSNAMTEALPGGQDLVLCRYLAFTYYRGARRLDAARRLAGALVPGGLLFTGRKEGMGPGERLLFEALSEQRGIYRLR